ncbi:MAG TPA: 1-phosphofructokinase [Capsulimonadaceae bacterium]|jgi:1-phosphofructokinase
MNTAYDRIPTGSVDVLTVTLNPAVDQTITIPDFSAGSVNRVQQVQTCAGGKGVNVASVLADFGVSVAVTGFLGIDNVALFEEMFKQRGISDRFLKLPGSTRMGVKIIDPLNRQTTDINFPGQSVPTGGVADLLRLIESIDFKWCVLAGSVPPGVDPAIYQTITAALKASGRKVAVDASGEPLRLAITASPDVVKPNIDELSEMLGRTISSRDELLSATLSLIASGVGLVVVSMGGDGAWFVSRDEAILAVPPKVDVVSTVGAGDAMVSGIVAANLSAMSLAECAKLATSFSLEAVSRVGAGLSRDADRWHEMVTLEKVDMPLVETR